jgi:hypothetical protein
MTFRSPTKNQLAVSSSSLASASSDAWSLVIRPPRKWLDLKLGELWRYRDLVMLFVRRDFVPLDTQTILGPPWYITQPPLTTVTFALVSGKIAELSASDCRAIQRHAKLIVDARGVYSEPAENVVKAWPRSA